MAENTDWPHDRTVESVCGPTPSALTIFASKCLVLSAAVVAPGAGLHHPIDVIGVLDQMEVAPAERSPTVTFTCHVVQ